MFVFEKEVIRKKTTWNAKKKKISQRLVLVMSCLDLGGRETREYVHDEWCICAGCRKKNLGLCENNAKLKNFCRYL